MLRDMLAKEISNIVRKMLKEANAAPLVEVKIVEPEQPGNGDYSTPVAFSLSKILKKQPQEITLALKEKLEKRSQTLSRVEAKSGFVNMFLKDDVLLRELGKRLAFSKKRTRINVEFVSANPTGPLTMANTRGGFYGDALANVLEKVGYNVTREYFINDAGNQIKLLGESIRAAEGKIPVKPEHYKGAYIQNLKGKSASQAAAILLKEIKTSLKRAGISFDVWFSEAKNIREAGLLQKTLSLLKRKKLAVEKEGALWFGESVLVKSDAEPTYLLSDLAYQRDKLTARKFDVAITVVGADHHAEAQAVQKGMKASGLAGRLTIVIVQLVRLLRAGREVRMGKRLGEFVTLDELLDEVGLDAGRWFFLEKTPQTHLNFDLDRAKERSENNPVYYVQYAHVRMQSILRKSNKLRTINYKQFEHPSERALIMKLLRYPEILEDISKTYEVHRLTTYAYELAQVFSAFYRDVRVLGSEREAERLYLVQKARETLGDALKLLGISRPERM